MSTPHDADFYTWAMEQAALLRAGKLDAADVSQIAEELESLGRSEAAACLEAAAETGLALKTFPDENPFTLDHVSDEFWPE
jgi:hypothetical protein